MKRRELLKLGASAAFAPLASISRPQRALAQLDYPNKPVRIVVDSAVGSANDATARILADRLGEVWNEQVVIFNQPGAGGAISARVAAQSAPDGYTLYMPATSVFLALPGGPGKELVATRCNLCHDLERVASPKRHKADWPVIVANMVARGATASPEEAQAISDYLVANFGD